MRGVIPQNRTLHDGRPTPDLARGDGKLELERADEGEQDRLGSVSVSVSHHVLSIVKGCDGLDKREAKANACSWSTDKGQQVTPDTWHLGDGLGDAAPPFRSAAHRSPVQPD